jgi:hypothetical protein
MTAPAASGQPVVVLLVTGGTWATLSASPGSPASPGSWARASVSPGPIFANNRTLGAYLTLGKGAATAVRTNVDPVTAWNQVVLYDHVLRYGGTVGQLGSGLASRGITRVAVGPTADVATTLVDRDGGLPEVRLGGPTEIASAVRDGAGVVVADVQAADLAAAEAATAGVCKFVVGVPLPDPGTPHLEAIAVSPECGLGDRGLHSSSTTRSGLVTYPDVTATVLQIASGDHRGEPGIVGSPLTAAGHRSTVAQLRDADQRSIAGLNAEHSFILVFVAAAFVVLLARRQRALRALVVPVAAALPAAAMFVMLIPWWRRSTALGVASLVAIAALVGAAAAVAARGRTVRAVAIVSGLTVLVIGADAVGGGGLQLDAPMMNSAIGGGRFHGIGNVPFGFLIGASIVLAAPLLVDRRERRDRRRMVAMVLLAALVVLEGAPVLGADVGGVLAMVPSFGVLIAMTSPAVRARHVLVFGLAALAVVGALAGFDLIGPASRQTHLGHALRAGPLAVLWRRQFAMLRSFRDSPWASVAAISVVCLATIRRTLWADMAGRAALVAVGAAAVLGTILNDSGVAVGGAVLAMAWPALASVGSPATVTSNVDSQLVDQVGQQK